jgi:four helix bundle protein
MPNRFESLPIFQIAHEFVLEVYKTSKLFPVDERFGLTSQIRRSVSSIPTNIVEGNARGHKKEIVEFLYIAKGSLEETKYHLLLSRDLEYISPETYEALTQYADLVGKQLNGLINYWKNKS